MMKAAPDAGSYMPAGCWLTIDQINMIRKRVGPTTRPIRRAFDMGA